MLLSPALRPVLFNKPNGNDCFTKLLIHCDGADAATAFVDSSASARTVTANGNAQVDVDRFMFGGASVLLDGNGDYLSVPDSADWNFGTSDFTIDLWARFNSFAAIGTLFAHGTNGSNGHRLRVQTTGQLTYELWSAGSKIVDFSSATGVVATGAWYHVAFVRSRTEWRLFVNGAQVASATGNSSSIADYTGTLRFGDDAPLGAGFDHDGWLDEIRVSSVARWLTNFTPPTKAYA